ncbi:ABC transporter ATP-binding protein [Inquilinus sp. Marseille-Q2685]|uniref:ABC transporter ATP-binding protein n=1 Tax=Inquilinus sp. Marseille-Q2685 TaxID=2866581 RepID=UPI001CE41D44|nr:ABC transporter ATP-binding protein [Inquilinus sp. Marseille-Q2685]
MPDAAGPPDLLARGVSARFRDRTGAPIEALRSVTARFPAGRLTAVVGPSGSGKTTLIHTLAGIVRPAAGEVGFGGTVVSALAEGARDAWRRRHCGLVFQQFRLVEELGALANVTLPALFSRSRLDPALRARARELLARFEVPDRPVPAARLSRGEQQRVALARALLLDPPIILADEPTASLDSGNGERVAAALAELAGEGRIVVCATHDPALAGRAAAVLTLRAGVLADNAEAVPAAGAGR